MTPWSEISSFHQVILIVVAFLLGYGILLRRLADLVQPMRLRLAEMGEKYQAAPLNARERNTIRVYLDNAFSARPAVVVAFLLPFIMIKAAWQRNGDKDTSCDPAL